MLSSCQTCQLEWVLDRVKIVTLDRKMCLGDLKIYYETGIKVNIYERKYNCQIKNEIQTVKL
jgi:hypothetical protein